MTDIWTGEAELDSVEDGEGAYDDANDDAYDESRASDRRRRLQRAQARRDLARRQGRTTSVAPQPTPQQTVRAINNLDVETKVQRDDVQRKLAAVNNRAKWASWAAVGSAVAPAVIQAVGITTDNPILDAAVRAAPMGLLYGATPRERGFGGFATSAPTIGIATLLGLAIVNDRRVKNSTVRRIEILGPSELVVGDQDVFLADVLDGDGGPLRTAVVWTSDNPAVATVDPNSGQVTAVSSGVTVIHAKADAVDRRFRLKIELPLKASGNTQTAPTASATK
jgi:hypothetical protein